MIRNGCIYPPLSNQRKKNKIEVNDHGEMSTKMEMFLLFLYVARPLHVFIFTAGSKFR